VWGEEKGGGASENCGHLGRRQWVVSFDRVVVVTVVKKLDHRYLGDKMSDMARICLVSLLNEQIHKSVVWGDMELDLVKELQ
jgi:hypothetical protein